MASMRWISEANERGTDALICCTGGTGSWMCFIITVIAEEPSNGGRPVTISNSVAPRE